MGPSSFGWDKTIPRGVGSHGWVVSAADKVSEVISWKYACIQQYHIQNPFVH